MINYVCGFCFNSNLTQVALIEKKKPKWQEGLFNGIGGKIEPNENAVNAMRREFLEEAGVDIATWRTLVKIEGVDWCVHFFYAVEGGTFDNIETQEEEKVFLLNVDRLFDYPYITNLEWLIPLAIYKYKNQKEIISF